MSAAVSAFPPAMLSSEPSAGASFSRIPNPAGSRSFAEFNLRSEPRPDQSASRSKPDESKESSAKGAAETDAAEPVSTERRPRRARPEDGTDPEPADKLLSCPCAVAILPPPAVELTEAGGGTEAAAPAVPSVGSEPAVGAPSFSDLTSFTADSAPSKGDWRDTLRSQASSAQAAVAPAGPTDTSSANSPAVAKAAEAALLSRAVPVPKTDTETNLPTASDKSGPEATTTSEEFAEITGKQGESLRGTRAALPVVEVKSWFQRDEFAASTSSDAGKDAVMAVPSQEAREDQEPAGGSTTEAPLAPVLSAEHFGESATLANPSEIPGTSPADQAAKVTSLLQDQVVRFRQTAREAVEVVLKPDSKTELHVQLVQRSGQIEASVRCDRGDAQALGSSWARLQESLAQQGVRLAPLNETSMSFAGEHSRQGFNPPPQSRAETPFVFSGNRTRPATAAPAIATESVRPIRINPGGSSRRSLESWA